MPQKYPICEIFIMMMCTNGWNILVLFLDSLHPVQRIKNKKESCQLDYLIIILSSMKNS